MYKYYISAVSCAAILFGFSDISYAQTTKQNVEELVNYACETHPTITSANLSVQQAGTRISEAKSLFLPTINSVSEVSIADDQLDEGLGVSGTRPYSTQLIVDQPIYNGGRARNEVKSARLFQEGLRFEGISQVIDIQSSIVTAYISLSFTLADLRVRRENLDFLRNEKNDAERRYALGGGTISNIVEVESRISRAEGDFVAAQARVNQARIALGVATGIAVGEDVDDIVHSKPILSYEDALADTLERNPQIKSAEQQIHIAETTVERVRADRRPQINLIGDLNMQRETSFSGFERDEARVRLRLDIPIFAGGRLAAQEKGAIIDVTRTEIDKAAVTRNVVEQIQLQWDRVHETRNLISVNSELVVASQKALNAIKKEVFEGFRPGRDVLDAQQELLEAQLRLEQSRFIFTQASFDLQFATGDVDAERFPKCGEAIREIIAINPRQRGDRYQIDLPIIGDVIGSEEGRRRRGAPNRR